MSDTDLDRMHAMLVAELDSHEIRKQARADARTQKKYASLADNLAHLRNQIRCWSPGDQSIACECGARAKLVGGDRVYPKRPGLAAKKFYLCVCNRYVGTHQDTGRPYGFPADQSTRAARSRAHSVFDPTWQQQNSPVIFRSRAEAYAWLSKRLGVNEVHMGELDAASCGVVINLVAKLRKDFALVNR